MEKLIVNDVVITDTTIEVLSELESNNQEQLIEFIDLLEKVEGVLVTLGVEKKDNALDVFKLTQKNSKLKSLLKKLRK